MTEKPKIPIFQGNRILLIAAGVVCVAGLVALRFLEMFSDFSMWIGVPILLAVSAIAPYPYVKSITDDAQREVELKVIGSIFVCWAMSLIIFSIF